MVRPGGATVKPADLMTAIGSRFRSRLHEPRTAAILGATLGVTFSLCFLTGLFSHLIQHPVSWLSVPTRPAGLYRVTQGIHVLTGITSIPILLAKLWVVSPKLWSWPTPRSVVDGIVEGFERLMLLPLVGGGLFLLFSGVANVARWYPYPFYFTVAHYQVAWVTVGAMLVHLGVKWRIAGNELRRRPIVTGVTADDLRLGAARRRFLGSVAGASGVVFLAFAGNTIRPLSRLAVLAQRRPGVGPQGLPVNKSAASARVLTTARDPGYRLVVTHGGRTTPFSLDDLRALPQRSATLPIACVEGWSTSARWRGVRVRDVLEAAGASAGGSAGASAGGSGVSGVRVVSLQRGGGYGTSMLEPNEIADDETLLALELNGEALHIDHGFPVRLIAPNRSGVLQTKWVGRLEVVS